jgi:predicted nuclease with TOPRIM domain
MDEKDIEHRLTEVEGRSKSNTHRLDELERRQDNLDDLVSTVKVLAVREENVENDVKEIKNDVKSLKGKPGELWDKVVVIFITALVSGLVGYALSQILKG